jgi:CRP-like cAMP-binding protein
MADLRLMKDRAADHLRRGRFDKAAELLSVVVASDPRDLPARQKLADALRRAGDDRDAIRVYRELSDEYASQGELLKAIAVCKVILDIDPKQQAAHEALAQLSARRMQEPSRPVGVTPGAGLATGLPSSPPQREVTLEIELLAGGKAEPEPAAGPPAWLERTAAVLVPPPPPEVAAARAEALGEAPLDLGAAFADQLDAGAPTPRGDAVLELEPEPEPAAPAAGAAGRLGQVPLFSDVSPEAFVALAERVKLSAAPAGATVLAEGERGRSLLVVVSGRLRVEKARAEGPLVLARLGEGDFFGEMALLSGEPRMASVVAEEDVELLEIGADVLAELCRTHHSVAVSLTRFYRRRLLANAMATSPVFVPFSADDRAALVRRFRTREVKAGDVLVREGQRSDGLFVVVSGRYDVVRGEGPGAARVAQLREGDLFGEMSCLSKRPAGASVVALQRGIVLRLPRADFDEIASSHPQVLEAVSGLADERRQSLEDVARRAPKGGPGPYLV